MSFGDITPRSLRDISARTWTIVPPIDISGTTKNSNRWDHYVGTHGVRPLIKYTRRVGDGGRYVVVRNIQRTQPSMIGNLVVLDARRASLPSDPPGCRLGVSPRDHFGT